MNLAKTLALPVLLMAAIGCERAQLPQSAPEQSLITPPSNEAPVTETQPPPKEEVPPAEVPPAHPSPVDVALDPSGKGALMPPAAPVEPGTRARKRMDIDQLGQAIRTVTGGIGWTEMRGTREVDLLEELAATLGRPDFVTLTTEDLAPTAMFQKFLGDASRSVCARLVTREVAAMARDRVFLVHVTPEDTWARSESKVVDNMRAALSRFHGRAVPAGAPELEPWIWLYRSVEHQTGRSRDAWQAVCVGLMTHPDFYGY